MVSAAFSFLSQASGFWISYWYRCTWHKGENRNGKTASARIKGYDPLHRTDRFDLPRRGHWFVPGPLPPTGEWQFDSKGRANRRIRPSWSELQPSGIFSSEALGSRNGRI